MPPTPAPSAAVLRLLEWFARHRRAMPWRDCPRPYAVWISEIMLQQTRVETVIPYFTRFLERFPDVASLAAADLEDVLRLWEGLGYYSRARALHRAARTLAAESGGQLPSSFAELRELPGFGPYTAAAVASIAFGEPVPTVDGNVLRVVCRWWAWDDDAAKPATRDKVFRALLPLVAQAPPGDFNQALMELGALVCKPRQPDCRLCPLRPDCAAHAQGRTAELPRKTRRGDTPHYDVAVAILARGPRLLVGRRPASGLLGGLWEFPGGKCLPGESLAEALRRRLAAETGLGVEPGAEVCRVAHAFTHFRITVHALRCPAPEDREPQARFHDELRWVSPAEAAALPFAKTARRILQALA